jgi:hypothetical protein
MRRQEGVRALGAPEGRARTSLRITLQVSSGDARQARSMDRQPPENSPAPDREPLAPDAESPQEVVHNDIWLPIAVALVVLVGVFGLAVALGG